VATTSISINKLGGAEGHLAGSSCEEAFSGETIVQILYIGGKEDEETLLLLKGLIHRISSG
jgi:hypothetical protein